jgi:gluconate kinase
MNSYTKSYKLNRINIETSYLKKEYRLLLKVRHKEINIIWLRLMADITFAGVIFAQGAEAT